MAKRHVFYCISLKKRLVLVILGLILCGIFTLIAVKQQRKTSVCVGCRAFELSFLISGPKIPDTCLGKIAPCHKYFEID